MPCGGVAIEFSIKDGRKLLYQREEFEFLLHNFKWILYLEHKQKVLLTEYKLYK